MLTVVMKSLGEKLKELRESTGLSLRKLAQKLEDVTATHLSDIERGVRYPSKTLLIKLAALHGISTEELEAYDSRKVLKDINYQATIDPSLGLQIQGFINRQVQISAESSADSSTQNDADLKQKKEIFDIEIILRLISSGIVSSFQTWEKTGISPVLNNKQLQSGLDRLIAFCLLRKIRFPAHIPALLEWCEKSFSEWKLPELPEDVHPLDTLLINKQPSFFCLDFARKDRDIEATLSEERYMQRVFNECAAYPPAIYTALRELLIRKPVLTESELIQTYLTPPLNIIPDLVKDAYEEAPAFLSHKGIFRCCPKCGNLLLYTLSQEWICRDESCDVNRIRKGDITNDISATNSDRLYQLKYPIRRYVAAPGRTEIEIYESLKRLSETFASSKIHFQLTLWPNLDAYDLQITFPDGEVWAVDVKDWSSPYILAQRVKPFRTNPPWDKAFFVFPDRYKKLKRNYLEAFKNRCVYLNERVDAFYETEFLTLVEQHLRGLYEKHK